MSTVILDTITGKSTATTITIGSTPVVSASANSMTIRGEGSNQTSIQKGLIKTSLSFDLSNNGTEDSNNVASVTDRGTGSTYCNFTNNMGSTAFTVTTGISSQQIGSMGTDDNNRAAISSADTSARASVNAYSTSDSQQADAPVLALMIVGDLS